MVALPQPTAVTVMALVWPSEKGLVSLTAATPGLLLDQVIWEAVLAGTVATSCTAPPTSSVAPGILIETLVAGFCTLTFSPAFLPLWVVTVILVDFLTFLPLTTPVVLPTLATLLLLLVYL